MTLGHLWVQAATPATRRKRGRHCRFWLQLRGRGHGVSTRRPWILRWDPRPPPPRSRSWSRFCCALSLSLSLSLTQSVNHFCCWPTVNIQTSFHSFLLLLVHLKLESKWTQALEVAPIQSPNCADWHSKHLRVKWVCINGCPPPASSPNMSAWQHSLSYSLRCPLSRDVLFCFGMHNSCRISPSNRQGMSKLLFKTSRLSGRPRV